MIGLVFQDLPQQFRKNTTETHISKTFFSNSDWFKIIVIGVVTTLIVFLTFITTLHHAEINYARGFNIAILSYMSVAITLALGGHKATKTGLITLCCVVVFVFSLIQLPWLANLVGFVPLTYAAWLWVLSIAFFTWLAISLAP